MYSLARKKRLPDDTKIVGFSRSPFSHDEWRKKLAETTQKFAGEEWDAAAWQQFAPSIFYQAGDMDQAKDFTALAKLLGEIEKGGSATRVYYLATAPQFYEEAVQQLGAAGLADEANGQRRVVIEKPFGTDLASAKHLNEAVHRVFAEQQVYRIDHYLGKETVQNMLVLRFANTIFEPIWNRNYIDHVQITVAEEVDVGRRGGYYDKSGVVRDMFQNHLLQLLMVTAMEAPVRFEADAVRDEKVKVLQAIRAMTADEVAANTLRGQYRGYTQEADVPPDSQTATFAAIKLAIENWRWQGVPFYLRSGKVDVVPHDANRHSISRAAAHAVLRRRPQPSRCQSPGHSSAAGRGHSAALSNQSSRCRHEVADDRFRFQFPARISRRDARGL